MSRDRRRGLRVDRSVREEVDEEVAFHLEEQMRSLVGSGMDEGAARAEALRMFGNRKRIERAMLGIGQARVREERRSQMLGDMRQDLGFALRYLGRRPGFSLVAVGVLALGIGAATAVFSIVDAALLRPLPFPDGERIVRLTDVQRDRGGLTVSYPEVLDWQREMTFLEAIGGFGATSFVLPDVEEPLRVIGARVVGDYPGVLGVPPVLGRVFTAEELVSASRVVMLGEALWRSRFGASREIVGQPLRMDDDVYTIIGVMPRAANLLAAREDIAVWLPFEPVPWATRGTHFIAVYGRIPRGVATTQAEARIEAVAQALREEGLTEHGIRVEGVRERMVADSRPLLIALAGAVACLLLIVCMNLANLFLSHSAARRREFAARRAVGADGLRLIRQLATEALVIATLGGILGGLFGAATTRLVAAAAQRAAMLAPADGIDLRVLLFTASVALLVALLAGLWPAVGAARADIAGTLRDSGDRVTMGRRGRRGRRILVCVEVALSVVLLAGAGLMVRSLVSLLNEDPGFRADNVLKFDVSLPTSVYPDAAQTAFFTTLVARLRALPDVHDAAGINELPLSGGDVNGNIAIVGIEFPPDEAPVVKKRIVTTGYFETLGIPVLRGRSFDETDRAGGREVVVISESLARRYWPDADPIGQRVRFSWGPGEEQEIIGVVGEVRHDALDAAGDGTIYRPITQFPFQALTIVVRAGSEPGALVPAIRAEVRSLDARLPVDGVMSLREVVHASVSARSTLMVLLTGFAALALLLAGVGVYAVTSQAVGQRTHEIGVRKALGAVNVDVLRLVVGQEAVMIAAGLALGIAGAIAGTPLLASSLYGVGVRDPSTLFAATALLGVIGLLAAWVPAMRAARLDPARALRSD
jgi:putative ABC transport system permease protein